jgi:hypothetical protein
MLVGTPSSTDLPGPAIGALRSWREFRPRWLTRRGIAIGLLALVALAPAVHVWMRAADAGRNIVYWDEFDTALALVLHLDDGLTPGAFFRELFAVNNEHRMVTSRLVYAGSYWLTGTVNFAVVSLIGNACLLALCVLLIATAGTVERRARLGVLLGYGLFQLENYENFLWSGASIDHFQIVMLAGLAVAGLAHGTRTGWLISGLCALLATFTLAHGTLLWPLGAIMLWRGRRWRQLIGWGVLTALMAGGYAVGFQTNPAHQFTALSLPGAVKIIRYWLAMLGTVPALNQAALAPWLGAGLLATLGWLGWRGAARQESIAYPLAWFGVAALGLIAVGRADTAGAVVHSRYLVLGALAWSLVAFMLIERYSSPRRPFLLLTGCLPLFVGFNLAANHAFEPMAEAWRECRDRAVARYVQHGADGRGSFALHPVPAHATGLLKDAESRSLFRMDPVCVGRPFPAAQPSARIAYFVDEITVNSHSVFIDGWAGIHGLKAGRDELQVVLRSATATHVFTTVTVQRPDVVAATREGGWRLCGFLFAVRRDELPAGDFQLGFLIKRGGKAEYIMTDHRLLLTGAGKTVLASSL